MLVSTLPTGSISYRVDGLGSDAAGWRRLTELPRPIKRSFTYTFPYPYGYYYGEWPRNGNPKGHPRSTFTRRARSLAGTHLALCSGQAVQHSRNAEDERKSGNTLSCAQNVRARRVPQGAMLGNACNDGQRGSPHRCTVLCTWVQPVRTPKTTNAGASSGSAHHKPARRTAQHSTAPGPTPGYQADCQHVVLQWARRPSPVSAGCPVPVRVPVPLLGAGRFRYPHHSSQPGPSHFAFARLFPARMALWSLRKVMGWTRQ